MKKIILLVVLLSTLSTIAYTQSVGDTSGQYFFHYLDTPISIDDFDSSSHNYYEYDFDQDQINDFGIMFFYQDNSQWGHKHYIEIYAIDSSTTEIAFLDTMQCYYDDTTPFTPTPILGNEFPRAQNSDYGSNYDLYQNWINGARIYHNQFTVSTVYSYGFHCKFSHTGNQYFIIRKINASDTTYAWVLIENGKRLTAYGSTKETKEENPEINNYNKGAVAFPNPASNKIIIQETSDLPNIEKVEVFAVTGDKMLQFSAIDQILEIDVNDWPNGLYIIKCFDESGGIYTQKIVVENP